MAGAELKLENNGRITIGTSNTTPVAPDLGYNSLFIQSNELKWINHDGDVTIAGGQILYDTTENILAISNPQVGMIRLSTSDNVIAFYNGTNWIKLQNNGNL